MDKGRSIVVAVLLLFSQAGNAAWEPVLRFSSLCDVDNQVCLEGRIDFDPNSKIIEIDARQFQSAGSGLLTFHFVGTTPLGEQVYHSSAVELRGRYGERISHKFGPPYSNRTQWTLNRLTFEKVD
ncbi:hypothetical protein ACXYTJ_01365 [Gilvimarinus sp. F26214L]|uniref:hypothetical protein n=1 Tax=Gilvimarinus sp. DZF01 TaxID=3461371 RepID=UPI0040465DFB